MKIAVAVASENALPTAFVVFRGIEESIRKAAEMGYDGIELALLDKNQVDIKQVKKLVSQYKMQVPVISTGQVFAGANLWFTATDPAVRATAIEVFKGLTEVAAEFGAMVNMGRVRGPVNPGETLATTEKRFADVAGEIAQYAQRLGVVLILEPVNRYEINFINSVDDGAALLDKLAIPNMKLMPDVFHMNIEDVSIEGNLKKYIKQIAYIHFADSNRLAPGWGHLDFRSIVCALREVSYEGWISVEILPTPDPDSAARQAISCLRKFIPA
jgi:sugar phosphate isomerase/epimerase